MLKCYVMDVEFKDKDRKLLVIPALFHASLIATDAEEHLLPKVLGNRVFSGDNDRAIRAIADNWAKNQEHYAFVPMKDATELLEFRKPNSPVPGPHTK